MRHAQYEVTAQKNVMTTDYSLPPPPSSLFNDPLVTGTTLILYRAPTIDPNQSISERARERYLKQDPLALVLSPSSVECRQCKRKIKLSSKSAYDPFHWRNHRTRCTKAHRRKASKASASVVCHHSVVQSTVV